MFLRELGEFKNDAAIPLQPGQEAPETLKIRIDFSPEDKLTIAGLLRNKMNFFSHPGETNYLTLEDLGLLYNELIKCEHDVNLALFAKLQIRLYKIRILQAMENAIDDVSLSVEESVEAAPESIWSRRFKKAIYFIISPLGVLFEVGSNFLGIQQLLTIFYFLSPQVSLLLSGLLSLITTPLFYSFDVMMLKQALGIKDTEQAKNMLTLDQQEITLTQKINAKLPKLRNHFDRAYFQQFANTVEVFNANLVYKKKLYCSEQTESLSRRIARYSITTLGTLLVVGGSYFAANSLLGIIGAAFGAALIGTPIGWVFLGLFVATYTGFFLSKRGEAMIKSQNPDVLKYESIKQQLTDFIPKRATDFCKDYRIEELWQKLAANRAGRSPKCAQVIYSKEYKENIKSRLEAHLEQKISNMGIFKARSERPSPVSSPEFKKDFFS